MKLDAFIESTLGGVLREGQVNAICECPNCGRADHFYVHRGTGLAFCHRCAYSVNLSRLIYDVEGVAWPEAQRRAIHLLHDRVTSAELSAFEQQMHDHIFGVTPDLTAANPVLPASAVSLRDPRAARARQYLQQRGFTAAHWAPYAPLYVPQSAVGERLRNHIIFPEYAADGCVVYYTTRAAEQKPRGPKSFHPQGTQKSNILFGLRAIPQAHPLVFVVEGPLDVLALPRHAVSLLGKTLSETQASMLRTRFKRIILCLDSDAPDAALRVAWRLHALDLHVSIVLLKEGDPADLVSVQPTQTVARLLRAAAPFNPVRHTLVLCTSGVKSPFKRRVRMRV